MDATVNGELDAMFPLYRSIAEHLASRPLAERKPLFDAWLCGQPDPEAVVEVIAEQDPQGPPPDPVAEEEEWGPLDLEGLPPVEAFPASVLPLPAFHLVMEGAAAIGCPQDFIGIPVLAIAGGVIGRSVSLMLKFGYFVDGTLYAACVGPPSDGKTPALKVAASAVYAIDNLLAVEHALAMERWREEAERPGSDGKKAKPPPKPKPRASTSMMRRWRCCP
jgi:hypothetical protein